MEPVVNFALWCVGLAAVAAVGTVARSAVNRLAGTGDWAEYGPNPSKERIAQVRQPFELYRSAVAAMVDGRSMDADSLWRRSAELGHLPAYTGLAMVEILDDRPWGAAAHLARAAEGGEDVAKILIEIMQAEDMSKHGQEPPPLTAGEFATALLWAQDRMDLDSVNVVIGVSLHFGKRELANHWASRRDVSG